MYFYQHTNTSQESFIKIINKGTSLTIGSMCSSHVLFLEAGFTYDGVGVRLFIRSAEWYTPVKIIMVLEEKCSDMLLATQLFMTQGELNCRKCKQKTVLEGPGNWHCDWLIVPLLLATSTILFSWIVSIRVIGRIARKWNCSDSSDSDSVKLMTPLITPTKFSCLISKEKYSSR